MKNILIISILLITKLSFAQTNYYYQNNGKDLKTTEEVWSDYESYVKMTNELDSSLKTITDFVIYHKEYKVDSIINYYFFGSHFEKNEKPPQTDFIFRQDPMFLLLNKPLPDFKLIDINGEEFTLDKIKGKPTLLNFTATYCKACMQEIPRLNKLKRLYQDKVNFIAIFDVERKPGDVKKTIEKYPFNFHILKNSKAFKEQLNIKSLPYNIFVDKDGYVRDIQRGYHYYDGTSENNYYTRKIDELIKI